MEQSPRRMLDSLDNLIVSAFGMDNYSSYFIGGSWKLISGRHVNYNYGLAVKFLELFLIAWPNRLR